MDSLPSAVTHDRRAMFPGRAPAHYGRATVRSLAGALLLAAALTGPTLAAGAPSAAPIRDVWDERGRQGEPRPPTSSEPRPGKPPKHQPPADREAEPPEGGERITSPTALNLYRAAGFRYQDTNYYACTSTSVMAMLNFVRIAGTGGSSMRWQVRTGDGSRDTWVRCSR